MRDDNESDLQYRGKYYVVFRKSAPNIWVWSVDLDPRTVESGQTASREAGIEAAQCVIDKVLAPTKPKLAGVVIKFSRDRRS
jgi:hypothetical protein